MGRMKVLLETMPIYLIEAETPALIGAATAAFEAIGGAK